MKPYELKTAIQRSGLGPLYLILGEEDYLRDQAIATIRAAVSGKEDEPKGETARGSTEQGSEAFNCELLYADETDASEILTFAQEVPIFATRSLVIVKWAEKLSARNGETLIPYLQAPSPSTTVVFVSAKLDGRLKWVQALKKQAVVVDCAPLYENHRAAWIKNTATQLSVRLNDHAVQLLKELAGENLYLVRHELDKLAAYVPQGTQVGPHDVEAVRGTQPGISVFDLAAAIGSGNQGRALRIVAKNLEAGEVPLRILGALVWQYRRIWKAKDLLRHRASESKAARTLGIPPFRERDFFAQVRQFSEPHLQQAFRLFWETDSALKGGAARAPARVLDSLMLQLCANSEKRDQTRTPSDVQANASSRRWGTGTAQTQRVG